MKYLIETIAVAFSIISVVLAMKKSIHNWTTGIIGILAYMVVFYNEKLYSDFLLQFIFLGQSAWGYYTWRKDKNDESSPVDMRNVAAMGALILFILYYNFGKNTENPYPLVDSVATTLSIVAIYLMSKKQTSCWLWWIAADAVYIFLFLGCRLYLSACLYGLFLYMATEAHKQWKKYEKV
jgi:nicotinamide mononucleotide transporter